jgi:transposase-like protein
MRTYTAEERAAAVGLAMSIGPMRAAHQLGYPVRTVTAWRAGERHGDDVAPIVAASRQEMGAVLQEAADLGASTLLAVMRDPKASAVAKVRAAEVAIDKHLLFSGAATSRTESTSVNYNIPEGSPLAEMTWEEREELRRYIAAIPDPLALTEGDGNG